MKTILSIMGTRPEIIKLAPVVNALGEYDDLKSVVLSTGQHREMSKQFFDEFGLAPDIDLDIMKPDQSLSYIVSEMSARFEGVLEKIKPDVVLVQGDTATAAMGGLIAYFHKIPVGHVEAGLRTYDIYSPHPEEINRQVIGRLATFNFVPTQRARQNLLNEAVAPETIYYVGNTVVDSLQWLMGKHARALESKQNADSTRNILVTAHRRENFGAPMENICRAIRDLAERFEDIFFVFPVHPNPNVRRVVYDILAGSPRVELVEPMGYLELMKTLIQSTIVLTDSGGIQEEAPTFHKPVLVMRKETERPEGIEAGVATLVGTDRAAIVEAVSELLSDETKYSEFARVKNPYGDGRSAGRIINLLREHLDLKVRIPVEPLENYFDGARSA